MPIARRASTSGWINCDRVSALMRKPVMIPSALRVISKPVPARNPPSTENGTKRTQRPSRAAPKA